MFLRIVFCMFIVTVANNYAAATDLSINVDEYVVDINDSNTWVIPIYVSGDSLIEGCNLSVQIGDGGTIVGGTAGPAIVGVDLESGIFNYNNDGQVDEGSLPQIAMWNITTNSGNVLSDGLLCTLSIDPNGFESGTWTLSLKDTLNGTTTFPAGSTELIPEITNGSITMVPEPSSFIVLTMAFGGLVSSKRRPKYTSLLVPASSHIEAI